MAASSETAALLGQVSINKAQHGKCDKGLAQYDTIPTSDELAQITFENNASWQIEAKLLGRYATPLVITYVLQYSYSFVTVLVAGQLGTRELAAASLATMTANITGLSVYEGLATSLDTLTAQAFGAGKKHLVGLHVQRMILLTLIVTIPIGALWLSSPWILSHIVPEKEVAYLAGDFLRFYLIGAPGYGSFEAVKRFTQAQGDFVTPMLTLALCAPLNILWNWLFVFKLQLGFRGAALAVSTSNIIQPLLFVLLICFFRVQAQQCWPGLQYKRALENWAPMVKLSLPGIVTILAEWLAFDILTLSASYLSTAHLAAQSVLMTISVLMFHIPMPTAIAASTRFGNLIGLGDVKTARLAFNTYYTIFLGIGIFDIILLTSLRHVIAQYFTRDKAVRKLITGVLPVVASAQLFDAMNVLTNGLIRGLGRQTIGGWVNFCVYYLFAVPLSLLLTFGPPHLELVGLWIGPLGGLGIVFAVLYFYMRYADWDLAVEEARSREE